MILLNFAHPITRDHLRQIEALTGQEVERLIEVSSHVDLQEPLTPQITTMVEACGLSPAEWQTLPLLISPPVLNFSAVTLLAALHGRCGYFPPCLRLRPVAAATPPRYEVAEILDLQAMQAAAREHH